MKLKQKPGRLQLLFVVIGSLGLREGKYINLRLPELFES